MNNNKNNDKYLIKRKKTLLEIIKDIIKNIYNSDSPSIEKDSIQVINSDVFAFNLPQYSNISKEKLDILIKEREKEITAIQQLQQKYGMSYQELLKDSKLDIDNKHLNNEIFDIEKTLDKNIEEDKNLDIHKNIDEYHETMINDIQSYQEIIRKLNDGEITEEDLSITDLLKIIVMLKEEVTIKEKNLENSSTLLEEIKTLENENKNLEEVLKNSKK